MKVMNRFVSLMLPWVPKSMVHLVARHYIAGETLDDALMVTRNLNQQGVKTTIDVLGEDVHDRSSSVGAVQSYKAVLSQVHDAGLDATVSVKPTQMGLLIDPEFCAGNIMGLVETAGKFGNFVRIDMEDATTTDAIIHIYRTILEHHSNVGMVLQSCLRRSLRDVNTLIPEGANVRLCKGIYKERLSIAYHDPEIISRNYLYLLEKLFIKDCYVGIATHDERLVHGAMVLVDKMNVLPERYEFQMLLGVEPKLRKMITAQGHRMRVYIPFGRDWYPYSVRRLKENPDNAGHVMKAGIMRIRPGRRREW